MSGSAPGVSPACAAAYVADYAALDGRARDVLDTWFGAPGSATFGTDRKLWFKRDVAFDSLLRDRFGVLLETAQRGELDTWAATPPGALALVIVLDQFSRNCHRGTARAFACDAHALRIARQMVASGLDQRLPDEYHRAFAYLPFEHDETMESQRESLRLFKPFETHPQAASYYRSAVRHAKIIERFGRFPHRNALLGRASTDEELRFLRKPGSSF
jgi:uncharacterized protein (DUF924 family)